MSRIDRSAARTDNLGSRDRRGQSTARRRIYHSP
jgi:hypothetical protein